MTTCNIPDIAKEWPGPRYGSAHRILHWGMAFLVLAAIALVEIKGLLPKGKLKYEIGFLHIQLGLLAFTLLWPRILWRITRPSPPVSPRLPRLQQTLAHVSHVSLYAMTAVLPLLGIVALQSRGKTVEFLGYVLPTIADEDKWLPYALSLRSDHELLGNILIGIICFHVAAAMFHHWIRRDDTLTRMLPGLNRRKYDAMGGG